MRRILAAMMAALLLPACAQAAQIVMAIADRMYDSREAAEEAKAHGGALN